MKYLELLGLAEIIPRCQHNILPSSLHTTTPSQINTLFTLTDWSVIWSVWNKTTQTLHEQSLKRLSDHAGFITRLLLSRHFSIHVCDFHNDIFYSNQTVFNLPVCVYTTKTFELGQSILCVFYYIGLSPLLMSVCPIIKNK